VENFLGGFPRTGARRQQAEQVSMMSSIEFGKRL
jgi:hypothetical protein